MKYLTGCANLFREGACDVAQFTLVKPGRVGSAQPKNMLRRPASS